MGDITEATLRFTINIGCCWGVHWDLLTGISWHIYGERNRRLRQYTLRVLRPLEAILKKTIKNVSMSFSQSLIEQNGHNTWEANILRQYPRNTQ